MVSAAQHSTGPEHGKGGGRTQYFTFEDDEVPAVVVGPGEVRLEIPVLQERVQQRTADDALVPEVQVQERQGGTLVPQERVQQQTGGDVLVPQTLVQRFSEMIVEQMVDDQTGGDVLVPRTPLELFAGRIVEQNEDDQIGGDVLVQTPQERLSERTAQQLVDDLLPPKQSQQRTVEQIAVDIPVPHGEEELIEVSSALVDLVQQRNVDNPVHPATMEELMPGLHLMGDIKDEASESGEAVLCARDAKLLALSEQ